MPARSAEHATPLHLWQVAAVSPNSDPSAQEILKIAQAYCYARQGRRDHQGSLLMQAADLLETVHAVPWTQAPLVVPLAGARTTKLSKSSALNGSIGEAGTTATELPRDFLDPQSLRNEAWALTLPTNGSTHKHGLKRSLRRSNSSGARWAGGSVEPGQAHVYLWSYPLHLVPPRGVHLAIVGENESPVHLEVCREGDGRVLGHGVGRTAPALVDCQGRGTSRVRILISNPGQRLSHYCLVIP